MQNTPAAEAAAIAQIPGTLSAYRTSYTAVLNEIRSLAPNANLYLLGYFNNGAQPGQFTYIDDVTISTGGFVGP